LRRPVSITADAHSFVMFREGTRREEAQDLAAARDCYTEAVRLDPNNAGAHFNLAGLPGTSAAERRAHVDSARTALEHSYRSRLRWWQRWLP
jgi:predicted TPR repeat methyltransferase